MLVHSTWLEIARMVVNSMFLCSHEAASGFRRGCKKRSNSNRVVKAEVFGCKIDEEPHMVQVSRNKCVQQCFLMGIATSCSSVSHGTSSAKGDGDLAPVRARGQCEAGQDFGASDPKWPGLPVLPEGDRFALPP